MGELREIEWVTVIACNFNKRFWDLGWGFSVDSEEGTIWLANACALKVDRFFRT